MNLDQALHTFFDEARDMLHVMEEALMRAENIESAEDDIHALFRAAHTIKGSAGLFGLEAIVAFTHVTESVLDRVRNQELLLDGELPGLLLSCCDQISLLVESAARNEALSEADRINNEQIVLLLEQYLQDGVSAHGTQTESESAVKPQENDGVSDDAQNALNDCWHISIRFGIDTFRNGMDPLSFIRYLALLGQLDHVELLSTALPESAAMDPESCYLGFEIRLRADTDKAMIENVFEFVRDDCTLRILAPHSKLGEFARHMQSLPEDVSLLGEILVRCGALTRNELTQALALQERSPEADEAAPKAPLGEILVNQGVLSQPVLNTALEKQKQTQDKRNQELKLIKVHADKLDHLINLVGELVIAGASAQLIGQRATDPLLNEATSTVTKLVEQIRDGALRLRMVQIGETFNRFQRVVRDIARELGKDVTLKVSGAETELDKSMVEKISDPLMHLVRNAMDHGIESADVRAAHDKPDTATVYLNAYHDSGSIVIEVSDDGGGINRARVFSKAVEKGLVAADATLSDHEILNLIMEPGFSTAAQVTNLSGRGVGMDVVKRNIEQLRGSIELSSEEGVGTTVRIRLPLTLAIIDGFLMRVGQASYVVPLDLVEECVELPRDAINQHHSYLPLRGTVLPLLRLRELFELEQSSAPRENVVVVRWGQVRAGLVVDALLGELQTVIKPLGMLFSQLRGVSGSTILGSGEVGLILDVPALVDLATVQEMQQTEHASGRRITAKMAS